MTIDRLFEHNLPQRETCTDDIEPLFHLQNVWFIDDWRLVSSTTNINNIIVFEKHANKTCRTAAIVWASILAPCHEVMSLRLDFSIDYQDIDSSNGGQGEISNGFLPSSDIQ